MIKLTNLQICKRIAEINGDSGHEFMGAFIPSLHFNEVVNESHNNSYSFCIDRYAYNPLIDDALLNQLILEHEVSINFHFCTLNMVTNKFYEMNFTDIPSLKRNILLLIIEAHKENV
ncbi:MAG: hypothetical protein Unbinned5350contig1004_30 [Prokaryotic dsDNA virus sp.]|nr:MAG: hypothetical protein Unbinned5350contig1004_30 [Prokaryotic dsDNA virus sp.]|tara:strand:+ start:1334 stop:1684 length:351 start_codon:yes stop_codon:yes gene_type:complete